MSENEIRVLYVQPGKYPEERTIPNTLRALQELVGGDIECCRPWRDSVCVICNDSGKIDGLPPNRLYGHTDFLAGSFVVCGNGGEDFISLTDRSQNTSAASPCAVIGHTGTAALPSPNAAALKAAAPDPRGCAPLSAKADDCHSGRQYRSHRYPRTQTAHNQQ